MKVSPRIEDGRIVLVFPDTPANRGCIELWDGCHNEASLEYVKTLPKSTDKEGVEKVLQRYNNNLPYWEQVSSWDIV